MSSGLKKLSHSAPQFTALIPFDASPAPTKAPTRPCVVDTGKPRRVASMQVSAAPSATGKTKYCEVARASGTSPLPPNVFMSPSDSHSAARAPARVVSVPHHKEVRKLAVPVP